MTVRSVLESECFSVWTLKVFKWVVWKCCGLGLWCANFKSYKLDFYMAKFAPNGKFVHSFLYPRPAAFSLPIVWISSSGFSLPPLSHGPSRLRVWWVSYFGGRNLWIYVWLNTIMGLYFWVWSVHVFVFPNFSNM